MNINKDVLEFLYELERNNNREWFTANKPRYEEVRKNIIDFVSELILKINSFDPEIGLLNAAKTLFRIYRDTRFSNNKDPYKTNLGSIIVPEGNKYSWHYPGYYLHLQNEGCFISMGIYMAEPAVLKSIRRAIDEDFEVFSEIVEELEPDFGKMSQEDGILKRVPTGFSKDSPAAEYLKLKHFYVLKHFSNKEVLAKDFIDTITELYKKTYKLKCWLAEAGKIED